MRKDQNGFSIFEALFILVVLGLIAFAGWKLFGKKPTQTSQTEQTAQQESEPEKEVSWSFNGTEWKASGTPPTCSQSLIGQTPVDMAKATAILYPGQTRGNDYKPHGGFLFGSGNNNQTVKVPLDAVVYKGSRYIEQGETQYFFVFIAPCGIMYRFDHLLTLSSEFQSLAERLPMPKENDSSTTNFNPAPKVKVSDVVATAVGFKKTGNASLDFGVYDLRQKNEVSKTNAWQAAHPNEDEFGAYGICWLDHLPAKDAEIAKGLPSGDSQAGKTSDYCK